MSVSTVDLLNLNVGVRADTFTFELLDLSRNKVRDLTAAEDATATVRVDTTRTVIRTLSGLSISTDELAGLNLLLYRVRPVMTLQNGAKFPLGVFMFGTDNRTIRDAGTTWTPDLYDETFILQQQLPQPVTVAKGGSVKDGYRKVIEQYPIPDIDLSLVTDAPAAADLPYKASSPGYDALVAMAQLLGAYPPFFDNRGTHRLKPAPATGAGPDHVYEPGGRIFDGSITETRNTYQAANRYIVTSSVPSEGAIVGQYDVPASAPNSFEHTNFRIIDTKTPQGISTQAQGNLAAYLNFLTDRNNYIQAQFNSSADPRHDCFDLVQLLGTVYSETGWSIDCRSGGTMQHSLTGFYGG